MRERLKNLRQKAANSDMFFISLFALALVWGLLPYYRNGHIILGGEGNYVLDYGIHFKKYSYMWFSVFGYGVANVWASGTGLNIFFLRLLEKVTNSVEFVNFSLIFLIYFLPFLFMYWACRLMKASALMAFMAAAFYVLNPFCLFYLNSLNQWNVFSLTAMPVFLCLILKNYKDVVALFFYSALVSLSLAQACTNPPTAVVIHFSMVISLLAAAVTVGSCVRFSAILGRYLLLLVSFCLVNAWWILGFVYAGASTIGKLYTHSFATSWLKTTVGGHGAILAKMFPLTTIVPDSPRYDFFSYWYSLLPSKVIALIPSVIVLVLLLHIPDKKEKKNALLFLVLLLVSLFFIKGPSGAFGFIYSLLFTYFPGFYIFKTPVEKFGLIYIFIFTILLLLVFKAFRSHRKFSDLKKAFIFYLIFCSIPLISGNLINNYTLGALGHGSRKYKEKPSYRLMRHVIMQDEARYRILSEPGMGNYQVCIKTGEKVFYTGVDPVLMNTDKPFLASQHAIDGVYTSVALPEFTKLIGLYNIKRILVNEDLFPWFGAMGPPDAKTIEEILDGHGLEKRREGELVLYQNKSEDYLPLVFTSYVGAAE